MNYKIEFVNSGKTVECPGDKTVLAAAQDAGIVIPFSCQGGTCHTCAVKAEGEMDCEEMLALSAAEMNEGLRLTCVGKPLGNPKIYCRRAATGRPCLGDLCYCPTKKYCAIPAT